MECAYLEMHMPENVPSTWQDEHLRTKLSKRMESQVIEPLRHPEVIKELIAHPEFWNRNTSFLFFPPDLMKNSSVEGPDRSASSEESVAKTNQLSALETDAIKSMAGRLRDRSTAYNRLTDEYDEDTPAHVQVDQRPILVLFVSELCKYIAMEEKHSNISRRGAEGHLHHGINSLLNFGVSELLKVLNDEKVTLDEETWKSCGECLLDFMDMQESRSRTDAPQSPK